MKNRINKNNRDEIQAFIKLLNKKDKVKSSDAVFAVMERWNISTMASLKEVQKIWQYRDKLPGKSNSFGNLLELIERDAVNSQDSLI
tara:strand:- start:1274 stop:1534 length:261 start_codon:yes stop_codon:yes gene_type:complete